MGMALSRALQVPLETRYISCRCDADRCVRRLTPTFPLVKAAASGFSTPTPQETVISVGTEPARVCVPTTTPTSGWNKAAGSERRSFLSNFKLSLTPAALAAIIFLIVLGAVLLVVYLANRRDQDKDKNP